MLMNLDQTQVWCTIKDHPACIEALHVGPGGYAVLLHFKLFHPHTLQFVETEIKQVVRALPYNAPYKLALSIIPTINDGDSGERYGSKILSCQPQCENFKMFSDLVLSSSIFIKIIY